MKGKCWLLGKLTLIVLCRCLHSLSRSVQQLRTSFQDHAVWKPLMKVRRQSLAELSRPTAAGCRSTLNIYLLRCDVLSIYKLQTVSQGSISCEGEVLAFSSLLVETLITRLIPLCVQYSLNLNPNLSL